MTDEDANGIVVRKTLGLKLTIRCDFCGKKAEYAWMLFESSDGKNHICDECVSEMMQVMCDRMVDGE